MNHNSGSPWWWQPLTVMGFTVMWSLNGNSYHRTGGELIHNADNVSKREWCHQSNPVYQKPTKKQSNLSQVRSGSQFPKPTLLSLGRIIKANGCAYSTWLKPRLMIDSHSEAEPPAKPAAAWSQTCPCPQKSISKMFYKWFIMFFLHGVYHGFSYLWSMRNN